MSLRNTLLGCALFAFGCSTSSTPSSTGSENSSGTDVTGDDTSSCTCSVSENGVKKALKCGESACVNGRSYDCASSGSTRGGTCTEETDGDSGSSKDSGTGPLATTVACKYHDFTSGKDVTECDAKTQYCLESTPSGGKVCANFAPSCSNCDCATDNAESEWKRLNNKTINCTGALILCSESNGAVSVTCKK